jgi:hypothetical protein
MRLVLEQLSLRDVCSRRRHLQLDVLFLVNVYNVLNVVLHYFKLLEFAFLSELLESFLSLLLFPHTKFSLC